jgi:hypothetical protein
VILPGMGAFIANNESSKISIIDKEILPPHKIISFNSSIINNDGLLINYLAAAENIPFNQASVIVLQQIAIWKTRMQLGEAIKFNEIGNLWLDLEKNIQFKSGGIFLQSNQFYGLNKIEIKPVIRNEEKENIIKQLVREDDKGLHVEGYRNDFVKKKSHTFRNWWIAAAAAVIIALVGVGSMFCFDDKYCTMNVASIISFDWLKDMISPKQENQLIQKQFIPISAVHYSTEKKNDVRVSPLSHPYTYYLDNPAEPYYVITKSGLDYAAAEKSKFQLWKKGLDARLIAIDSTYQIGIYYFVTSSEIQLIQTQLDTVLKCETQLMKISI